MPHPHQIFHWRPSTAFASARIDISWSFQLQHDQQSGLVHLPRASLTSLKMNNCFSLSGIGATSHLTNNRLTSGAQFDFASLPRSLTELSIVLTIWQAWRPYLYQIVPTLTWARCLTDLSLVIYLRVHGDSSANFQLVLQKKCGTIRSEMFARSIITLPRTLANEKIIWSNGLPPLSSDPCNKINNFTQCGPSRSANQDKPVVSHLRRLRWHQSQRENSHHLKKRRVDHPRPGVKSHLKTGKEVSVTL